MPNSHGEDPKQNRVEPASAASSRRVIGLAAPLLISSLAAAGLGFLGAVQVAPLGADALVAVGFGAMVTSLVQALGFGLFAGGRIAIAQALGAGDEARAARLSRRMLTIALVLALGSLALIPLSPALLHLIDVPPHVVPQAADYLVVRLMGAPLMFALDAAVHIVQGRADPKGTRLTMYAMLLLGVVALGAAPILIYTFDLGVAGAAWAANAGIVLGLLLLSPRVLRHLRGAARSAPSIVALGWPLAALNMADVGSHLALQSLLAHIGEADLAAHVLVLRLAGLASLPAYAVGDALSVMIGRAAGARRPDLVRPAARMGLRLVAVLVGVTMTTFLLGSEALASASGATPDVAQVASRLMVVAAIFQIVEGLVAVGLGTLAGLGHTRFLFIATMMTAWLVKLPVTALFTRVGLGVESAWWATGLELVVLVLLLVHRIGPALAAGARLDYAGGVRIPALPKPT